MAQSSLTKAVAHKGEYRKATVPVDSFEANPWGLYQVHGNVWEWTEDCWNDSNTGNPGNGSARTTGDCSRRVLRGGSWVNSSAEPPRGLPRRELRRQPEQRPRLPVGQNAGPDRSVLPQEAGGMDDLLTLAARRIELGDVTGAREMLASAGGRRQGPITFALAETYDPNMLGAWGSRGVAADIAKARALYRKALNLGVTRAQTRLEALK